MSGYQLRSARYAIIAATHVSVSGVILVELVNIVQKEMPFINCLG